MVAIVGEAGSRQMKLASALRRPLGRSSFWIIPVLAALTFGVSLVSAQTATGRISGTVLDPTGAAVPDAKITFRGESSGATFSVVTSSAGGYTAIDLPAGVYAVEVEMPGFRRHLVHGIKVDVATEASLPPIRLEIGEITFVVEVEGGVSQVQTTTAELTSTVTSGQIADLPLINRDPLGLIHLQAGVVSAGRTATAINGQRTSFSNVTLDGINIQDNYIRGNGLDFLPNRTLLDQVSEFTITTQNANSAVSGGSSHVSFTTPSGGSEYHGGLYWHNRNSALSAAEWFSNRQGLPKPFLNQNQVGGSLGGPILKNKLFFYTNYEAFRRRSEALDNATILTAEARRGIFRYFDQNENLQQVNVLRMQALQVDPAARAILDQIPGPDQINNFDVGDSDRDQLRNTAGYRFLTRDDSDRDAVTNRFDWALSAKHLVSATHQYTRERNQRPDAGNGYHRIPVVEDFGHTNFLSLAWRWSPGPRWSNELRGGFNLAPGDFRTTENRGDTLLTGFLFRNPVVNFAPEGRYTDTFNFMNNTAHQLGNHSLRFGVQTQQVRVETFDSFETLPTFVLNIEPQSQFALADRFFPGGIDSNDFFDAERLLATLGGIVGRARQTFNVTDRNSGFVPVSDFRRRYSLDSVALYFQDGWRVTPRFTLNLGLRWEYFGRFDERDGLMLNPVSGPGGVFDMLRSDAILDFAGGEVGRPLWEADLNNYVPNVGIAWDLFGDGRTAIRAGYSINYVNDEVMQAAQNATRANDGLQGRRREINLDLFLSGPLLEIDTPEFKVPRNVSENQALDPLAALFTIDPRLRTPYVQQWNFGIQHDLGWDTVFEVRYVGNKGTKLLRAFDFNQVVLRENGFLDDFLRARSNGFLAEAAGGFNPEFDPEFNPGFNPKFNPSIVGSQPLTFFKLLKDKGLLSDPTFQRLIKRGEPGQLAFLYIFNRFTEGTEVDFRHNRNALVTDMLTNFSNSSYHAFQTEVRRRAAEGLMFQANYSFSKVLTDSSGTQVRFDPFLDIAQPDLERARADFDLNHVFNLNFVYELPFAARLQNKPGLEKLIGGWTISSIFTWQSGAPVSILSGRGTINRVGRGENTAVSNLTKEQLDDIVGFRMTSDGPFFVAESAINPLDGRGVAPDSGEPEPFPGQAFFHPDSGEAGTLQRRMFSGPSALALNFAVNKTTRLTESQSVRFGASFSNFLNHPTFLSGDHILDATQFGRVTSTLTGARVIELHLRYSF